MVTCEGGGGDRLVQCMMGRVVSCFVWAGSSRLIRPHRGSKPPERCRRAARWRELDSTPPSGKHRDLRCVKSSCDQMENGSKMGKKFRRFVPKSMVLVIQGHLMTWLAYKNQITWCSRSPRCKCPLDSLVSATVAWSLSLKHTHTHSRFNSQLRNRTDVAFCIAQTVFAQIQARFQKLASCFTAYCLLSQGSTVRPL